MERRLGVALALLAMTLTTLIAVTTGSATARTASACPSDGLALGQRIVADTSCSQLTSPGGHFTLYLGDYYLSMDQNAHATDEPAGTLRYETGPDWYESTYHAVSAHKLALMLRRNGNLVLVTPAGRVLWSTKSAGKGVTRASVTDKGQLVLRTSDGKLVWASNSGRYALGGGDRLNPGGRLMQTSYDWTCTGYGPCTNPQTPMNKVTVSVMQRNGDFVARCPNSHQVAWHTNTHVPGSFLTLLESGALVVESPTGRILWSSHTRGIRYAIATLGTQVFAGTRIVWSAPEMGCLVSP